MTQTYCEATLNYAGSLVYEPTMVSIFDGRSALSDLHFETCGFTFLNHQSAVKNWQDEHEVARVHMPEIKQLAKDFLGCREVVVYPPLLRSPATAKSEADYAPIESVHSDYTEDYRAMVRNPDHVYQDFLGPMLAENGLSHDDVLNAERIAVIQFWRNIGELMPDRPLAVCDASTVARDEMITIPVSHYGGMRLDFEAFAVGTPADASRHCWYTFPKMQLDEVLVFRTYDSLVEDRRQAFYTPHTAFLDPKAGNSAPKRESVEMRALCLF